MNLEEFVQAVRLYVEKPIVDSIIEVLEEPVGRVPDQADVERSKWYATLDNTDKDFVKQVSEQTAIAVLFSLFAALDGARALDMRHGDFELYYVVDDERFFINSPDSNYLHDAYIALTQE